MFRRLHLKMTFFCTLVTGFILVCMTLSCLLFFESLLKKNDSAVFEKNRDAIVAYLEGESVIDYEQLSKVADNTCYTLTLYEHGNRLSWSLSSLSDTQKELIAAANEEALYSYHFDVKNPPKSRKITKYLEFSMQYKKAERLISYASLPNRNGSLCALIVYSRLQLARQIKSLRILFLLIDLIALLLLFLFAWKFSAHILKPVEENRKKQTDRKSVV